MDINRFIKDRDTAIFSLDEMKIRAYGGKYQIQFPATEKGFWGGVYKACLSIRNCPIDMKIKAKSWLKENNMSESSRKSEKTMHCICSECVDSNEVEQLKQANAELQANYDELNQFDKTQTARLMLELAEIKELLELAMKSIRHRLGCTECREYEECVETGLTRCDGEDSWQWQHQDRLEKALGSKVKPMTNHERIKNMTVKEMAEFLDNDENRTAPCNPKYCKHSDDSYICEADKQADCYKATETWLESEGEINDK